MKDGHLAKRVLVAGGAGFIGSNLCDRLVQQGSEVICADTLETGRMDNIRPLRNHPRFSFRRHDIVAPLALEGPIDRIYNLACPASPRHYQLDPLATLRTNVIGALNLLDLAREKGARILQASTSEVYGDPRIHPQPETYLGDVNIIGPRACYDEGKRCAETAFFDHRRMYGTDIKVVRIFNTYGPRMREDDGRVISNFIVQALGGRPLTIYGDGGQTRSFCFIDDLVRGLEAVMESPPGLTGPFNLGNPHEVPIRDIAREIVARTGAASPIVHRPLPEDDPKRRRPVIDRARELLGWQPRVTLGDGLKATIDYFALRLPASGPPPGHAPRTGAPLSAAGRPS